MTTALERAVQHALTADEVQSLGTIARARRFRFGWESLCPAPSVTIAELLNRADRVPSLVMRRDARALLSDASLLPDEAVLALVEDVRGGRSHAISREMNGARQHAVMCVCGAVCPAEGSDRPAWWPSEWQASQAATFGPSLWTPRFGCRRCEREARERIETPLRIEAMRKAESERAVAS